MATVASIQSALVAARTLQISNADMVSLLDQAIAGAFVDASGSLAVTTVSSDGNSITMSLDSAQRLRSYYAQLGDCGGCFSQAGEFAP